MSETEQQRQAGDSDDEIDTKEQDRFLPIANIARIMKRTLPDNAKISKDAKEAIQECVSEFISFVTSEASDRCQQEKRKTINGEDVLWAMHSLGFENYSEALKHYLIRYREESLASKTDKDGGQPKDEGGNAEVEDNTATLMMAVQMQAQAQAQAQAQIQAQAQVQGLTDPNMAAYLNKASGAGQFF